MVQKEEPPPAPYQKKPVLPKSEPNDDLDILHQAPPSALSPWFPECKVGISMSSAEAFTNNPPRAAVQSCTLLPNSQKRSFPLHVLTRGLNSASGLLCLR